MDTIDDILRTRINAQKEHAATLGTRAFYNLVFLIVILATNYAVFLWAAVAVNIYFLYSATRDLSHAIEEERGLTKSTKKVKKIDDRT